MSVLKLYDYFPIEVEKGRGNYIYSKEGNKYLDTFSGIGVHALGHRNHKITDIFIDKIKRHSHLSNFFLDENAEPVARKLTNYTDSEGKVFFTNSGTESIEGIIKIIQKESPSDKNLLVNFQKGFHGRTTGALAINGFDHLKAPFQPLLPNTIELPLNNVAKLENFMEKKGEKVAALFLEPVQGSGGIRLLDNDFAKAINDLKEEYGFILVSDEIQAGLGRTGKNFSYQWYELKPDLIAVAKSLGCGLPLGAILMLNRYQNSFQPGEHGSTFAPNPIALAGANHLLDRIPELLSNVLEQGNLLKNMLKKLDNELIQNVRGKGLMVGIQLKGEYPELRNIGLEHKILLNVLRDRIIRLLPPLNISEEQIEEIVDKIEKVLCSLR